jgi:hypothetical protein
VCTQDRPRAAVGRGLGTNFRPPTVRPRVRGQKDHFRGMTDNSCDYSECVAGDHRGGANEMIFDVAGVLG